MEQTEKRDHRRRPHGRRRARRPQEAPSGARATAAGRAGRASRDVYPLPAGEVLKGTASVAPASRLEELGAQAATGPLFDPVAVQLSDGIPLEYRGFQLDPFQREAIKHLEAGRSVLVSAPTGVGKTLVADYLIERMFKLGHRVIYTAPIKALSNQKFKEFKRLLGAENVGIITGDVTINSGAQILIMTTEIFRNMLHLSPEGLEGVSHVIFDEVHYLADEERGTVWEESIIFMPESMRLLGLSATIPNADELAFWIQDIKGHEVAVVRHFKRVVPLRQFVYDVARGACTLEELKEFKARRDKELEEADELWASEGSRYAPTTHLDLVASLTEQRRLPCLYFVFSRRQCEEKADELARSIDYLSPSERREILNYFDDRIDGMGIDSMPSVKQMRRILQRGIAYHHAGLLPVLKEIVEDLFERRLISVLYATETFAVGINFPVKSVCFDSVRKFNGVDFQPMTAQEYFQMAGRAGRRGIDLEGYVYILVDLNYFHPEEFPSTDERSVEPLVSRFTVSYNTVVNLIATRSADEIRKVLKQNFASYQTSAQKREIEAGLASARELETEIVGRACETLNQPGCPLYATGLNTKLAELRLQLKRVAKRRRSKERRASIKADMDSLRAELGALTSKECSTGEKRACRRLLARRGVIVGRMESLYERMRRLGSEERFVHDFKRKQALLERLGYIQNGRLLPRGEIAREIHTQELLVTELVFSGVFHDYDEDQIAALAVCIDYEPRRGEFPAKGVPFDVDRIRDIAAQIELVEESYTGASAIRFFTGLAPLAYKWSQGADFAGLLRGSNYAEGDVVSAFRRGIDLLRQVRAACKDDPALTDKITETMKRIDRDVVEVIL
ncbi:MAG: DEAD/DEAH box helicase [Clostridia bacterium]|nr:DEAD/DEAH box helicase [Clostridia bacterium]